MDKPPKRKTSEKKSRTTTKTSSRNRSRSRKKTTRKEAPVAQAIEDRATPSTVAAAAPTKIDSDGITEPADSDFGAGIFNGQAPPAHVEDVRRSETPQEDHGKSAAAQSRKSRARKSRTRRLAEQAEVIAAITHPAPAGDQTPTKQPAAARHRKKNEAAGDTETRTKKKTARRSRGRRAQAAPSRPEAREAEAGTLDFDAMHAGHAPEATAAQEAATPERPPAAARPPAEPAAPIASEHREMLINAADPEECRIAILSSGRLDELHVERAATASNVGNIYKGVVNKVEPSIQAAFVDFGLPAQGFLHISDLHPRYFPDSKGEPEVVGMKTPRSQRPPIQNCIHRGQQIIVQVIKEGIGTKGPTLSSYISIPGRFLVMMPGMEQLGVSRKIADDEKRRKMRDVLGQLSLPKGMGFILRTAGVDRTKRDLQRDLNYLSRLWKQVEKRIKREPAPAEIYRESDLVIRTIRDVYDSSIRRIIVDNPTVCDRVREFLAIASPRAQDVVKPYEGTEPLFHRYGIEAEIDRLHLKTVPLPCGGSLVIEQTEALVAIDVNSGRFRIPDNAEETAFQVNLEAADEIARQLRLRDLGGLIICDLIDMDQERHRRTIERRLSDALRKHKERAKVLRISRFGLLEMTRQRQRQSLDHSLFRECPRCAGSGRVKAPESVALDAMRRIHLASQREGVARIDVRVATAVANDLLNRKRHHLTDLERKTGQTICIHAVESFAVGQIALSCSDRRGREVHEAGGQPVGREHPRRTSRPRSHQQRGRRRRR